MSASDKIAVIRVRGLVTRFGAQTIHDGLDLNVRRGEVLGVVGGSGTGKSVLLKTIIGLIRPAAGTIQVLGDDTSTLNDAERIALQSRWGVLFQDGALFSSMTVAENIQVPLKEHTTLDRRNHRGGRPHQDRHDRPAAGSGLEVSVGAVRRHEEAGGAGPRAGARSGNPVPG